MNFQSLRVKYTTMFLSAAVFITALILMYVSLISTMEGGLVSLGEKFNPAISAVINADRDLYQARAAELEVISHGEDPAQFEALHENYSENAQQAIDRMRKFQRLMSQHPSIVQNTQGVEVQYLRWKEASSRVFSLVKAKNFSQARQVLNGESLNEFNKLRKYYDAASEATDEQSLALSSEILASVTTQENVLLLISFFVVIGTLAIGFIAPKTMSDALIDLTEKLQDISQGDGDLTKRINSNRPDEIGDIANSLDQFVNDLGILIGNIANESSQLVNSVDKISDGTQQVNNVSAQQLDEMERIANAVLQMSDAINEVATNAQLTSNEIKQVNELTVKGSEITQATVKTIEGVSKAVGDASQVISQLSENSKDIASVIDVIRGIAEQTNLLALNAAIEAARAGEQGRGFAVVADEVRTLASRTQQSTQDIQKMIENIQQGGTQAVISIEQGHKATHEGVALAKQTLTGLDEISLATIRVLEIATKTATASEQQSSVANELRDGLDSLTQSSRANVSTSDHNGELAMQTKQFANSLSESVSHFKL